MGLSCYRSKTAQKWLTELHLTSYPYPTKLLVEKPAGNPGIVHAWISGSPATLEADLSPSIKRQFCVEGHRSACFQELVEIVARAGAESRVVFLGSQGLPQTNPSQISKGAVASNRNGLRTGVTSLI